MQREEGASLKAEITRKRPRPALLLLPPTFTFFPAHTNTKCIAATARTSCPQIRRRFQILSNHCNHHHNGAHWQLCGPTPFFSHISSYYRAIVSQREGSPVAKSARQAAAGALFVRLQLGGSSLMPCPGLCAPAGPSRCHRLVTAQPSSVKAMQYWRIVELNAILWG